MTILVSFRLPAEYIADATGGILLGEFNDWNPELAIDLERTEDGSLQAQLPLAAGRTYQYRYLLNDGRWVNDNSNTTWTAIAGNYVENCVVEVPEAEKTITTEKKPAVKKASAKKPVITDDLTKITGINKKIAAFLKKQGIYTYKDLSKTTIRNLRTALGLAGTSYNKYDPSAWPKQAKLAAAGDWQALEILKNTPSK